MDVNALQTWVQMADDAVITLALRRAHAIVTSVYGDAPAAIVAVVLQQLLTLDHEPIGDDWAGLAPGVLDTPH